VRWVANNLVSKERFLNFKIDAEYKVEAGSNSGIYLRGRYELQILDDYGDATGRPDFAHMAIYGRTPPRVNASKPAGEWQIMEAILVGNRVTVTLNGQRVHDNAIITGVTGGALDNDELAPGPIMVQGDHRSVCRAQASECFHERCSANFAFSAVKQRRPGHGNTRSILRQSFWAAAHLLVQSGA